VHRGPMTEDQGEASLGVYRLREEEPAEVDLLSWKEVWARSIPALASKVVR